MQMFVCVRARDGRPTLVQLTRKFACTNWFGSGPKFHLCQWVGSGRDLGGSGRGSEKSDPPSTLATLSQYPFC
jgi:hypothetical protein